MSASASQPNQFKTGLVAEKRMALFESYVHKQNDVVEEKQGNRQNISLHEYYNGFVTNERCKGRPEAIVVLTRNQIWVYDCIERKVFETQSLKYNHGNGSMVKADDEIYVISGKWTNKVEKIDLTNAASEWTEVASTVHGRYLAASVASQESIVIVGGYPAMLGPIPFLRSRTLSLSEEYKVNVDEKWRESEVKNDGLYGHALVRIDDVMYIVGGEKSNALKCFDPNVGKWHSLPPMTYYRGGLAAVVFNGEIYAIGGRDQHSDSLHSVEKYNVVNKHWSDVASLNVARNYHGACVANGKIYVVGGNTDVIESFDPEGNLWREEGKYEKFIQVDSIIAL